MAYSPTLGGSLLTPFPSQFPHSSVSMHSLAATPIDQLSNDGRDDLVAHGSGFFWRFSTKPYLITARHVLSGRNPFDDSAMSDMGYFPTRIRVYPSIGFSPGNWTRTPTIIELDRDGEKLWFQDPDFHTLRTDIAAVAITIPDDWPMLCLNDDPGILSELVTQIGFECSIVGYPYANSSDLMTPIWRRATIASEPLLPIDGKPMFLLDASTSPGFSGSPVFRLHIGPAPVYAPPDRIRILADRVVSTFFVGVYAGRLRHAHYGGEVPFAFYGNRIPFILESM